MIGTGVHTATFVGILILTATGASGQTPTITSVVNSAAPGSGVAGRLCPGLLATVNGTNLGTSASIQVTVAGKRAAVLQAQDTALLIEIPVDAPIGATNITAGASAPFNINLSPFAPAVYASGGVARAVHLDGTTMVDQSHPAAPGETIVVYATGLGQTAPIVPTGTPTPGGNTISVVNTVSASVGGQSAKVIFAGLTPGYAALYQINMQLPASGLSNGPQTVQLTVTSPDSSVKFNSNSPEIYFALPPPSLVLVNNYSNVLPGLPNYGIAQGAIFDIYGSGLAHSSVSSSNFPLQTTLGGVTVNVTVNGTTVHPPIYFATPNQLGVVLPSNTPVGDGQISVTNGSGTIGPAPIHVVQSAFGLLTLNGLGTGMAAMYDANFKLVGLTNSIQAGEIVNLFGSGLGPSADSDTNLTSAPINLAGTLPVTVLVGGQNAQVTYAGRSGYPGLDQIQIMIPPGTSPGCFVGIVVQTGKMVSNFGTIPITAAGRACSEPTLGVTADALQSMLGNSRFGIGSIELRKETDFTAGVANSATTVDKVNGLFFSMTPAAFNAVDLPVCRAQPDSRRSTRQGDG